ncbi:MAG: SCP2 sterol-binding domain-containing protein [Candidatus Lokiarchaeota archaeon]|nr:SCP2 sterol-binding domain-containing protein [Candidatus Lokiarchaeota archaeon]
MFDHEKGHRSHRDKGWVLGGAITAVIAAGIAMQLVAVLMLAIPNLSFDSSNPSTVYPAYFLGLAIAGIGVGTTLAGARLAIKLVKRAMHAIPTFVAGDAPSGTSAATRAIPAAGPAIIRPALVKKESTGAAPLMKVESTPQKISPPPSTQAPSNAKPVLAAVEMPASSGPADLESVKSALSQIMERYGKPDVRSKFDGWVNNLVMEFPDINKAYTFKINSAEGIDMVEGKDDNAAVQVTMASDMFVKLLSKQINAIKAYSSGALKVKGEMKNLLKLRKLMF